MVKKKLMKVVLSSSLLFAIVGVCVVLTACPADTEKAANGVHAYLVSLKAFQDAEIQLHKDAKVSDIVHWSIQEKIKTANGAARHMDACILAKTQGNPVDTCINEAKATFQDVLNLTNATPDLKQGLSLVAQVASDALQNAIVFIEQIKTQTKPSPSNTGMLLWAFGLPMIVVSGASGLSGVGGVANSIYQIIQIILQMEPVALQALAGFLATKGKDTAAILALNATLEDQIDATADAELANKPKE